MNILKWKSIFLFSISTLRPLFLNPYYFNIVCVSVIYIGKGNEDGVEPPLLKGWTKGGLRQLEARS